MKRTMGWILAASAAALLACHGSSRPGAGDARVGVSTAALTSKASIGSVSVTVTGGALPAGGQSYDLTQQSLDLWTAFLQNLPAGQPLTFTATAWSGAPGSTKLFEGSASATPLANRTIGITIYLNELNPSPFSNDAPIIRSLFASADTLAPGAQLVLTATALDPDGDAMTFAWSANGGAPASESHARAASASAVADTFTWTAPPTQGTYTITLTITDGRGGQTVASFDVVVTNAAQTGDVAVRAVVNDAPRIDLVTVAPRTAEATLFDLAITAHDHETPAASLAYAWSTVATPALTIGATIYDAAAACDGAFTGAGATRAWQVAATVAPGTRCTVQVVVSDGNGSQNVGTVTFLVGAVPPTYPPGTVPTFVASSQSNLAPIQGSSVTFGVDVVSVTPVTLTWTTNFGAAGATRTLTPPPSRLSDSFTTNVACGPAGSPATVSVTATQNTLTSTYVFELSLPGCP